MNPQEAAEASAARQVAIAYLQQRGYRTAAQRLAENDNARSAPKGPGSCYSFYDH